MQVSVEKVSNVERRLTITVPSNLIEEAFVRHINQIAKKANIKGFRPGKAPLSYIQQHFGGDAQKQALSEVIEKSLYQALTEQKLNPITSPRVEPKRLEKDHPFEFSVSFEVLPEIDAVQFSLDKIEKPKVEISENDINLVMKQLTKQYTEWSKVDREAASNDRVVIDYHPIFEGKTDLERKVENYPLELGSNQMIPGFEDGLLGSKPGEERTLKLTFPDDYQDKEKAGKPIEFVVTVKNVYEAKIPEVDNDFIKKLGVKSGEREELDKQIRQSLEQERDRLIKEKLKDQLFTKLLELNKIEVPNSLIAREAKKIHDEIYPRHVHHEHQHSDDETKAFSDLAKKRVTLGILIAEYAKQKELKVDAERVNERVKQIASAYENPQEVINWLSAKEHRADIEAQVMEDQVMDSLLHDVSIIEKEMTYADLKGIRI